MARLFGTDGVRGIANKTLTAKLAYEIGFAAAIVLAKCHEKKDNKPVFLIGSDTRISCRMLEAALESGILSAGADVIKVGVIPTPGVAYLTTKYVCDAGVMISASHNSYEYNGIKLFSSDGFKLADNVEDEIEEIITNFDSMNFALPEGDKLGSSIFKADAASEYIEHLKRRMSVDLSGMKLAIDCANGSASAYAPKLFEDLGATVVVTDNKPNGLNINKNCGSTHLGNLIDLTVSHSCDMGLAFDGDADRFLAIDNNGKVIDGDVIMSIVALDMKKHQELKKDTLVITVMSNLGVQIMSRENDLNLATTKVGDRYVLEEMLKSGYNLGGEQSGHVILLDHATTGDGMLTALALLKSIYRNKTTLSNASLVVTILPQVLLPAYVRDEDKETVMNDSDITSKIEAINMSLGNEGRVLVRPSGTEPMIRVMLEGKDLDNITALAKELVDLISSKYSEK